MVAAIGQAELGRTLQTLVAIVAPFGHSNQRVEQAGQQLLGGHGMIEYARSVLIAQPQGGTVAHEQAAKFTVSVHVGYKKGRRKMIRTFETLPD